MRPPSCARHMQGRCKAGARQVQGRCKAGARQVQALKEAVAQCSGLRPDPKPSPLTPRMRALAGARLEGGDCVGAVVRQARRRRDPSRTQAGGGAPGGLLPQARRRRPAGEGKSVNGVGAFGWACGWAGVKMYRGGGYVGVWLGLRVKDPSSCDGACRLGV
eukprot:366080-Chlamydomonas_euryale.AAC.2